MSVSNNAKITGNGVMIYNAPIFSFLGLNVTGGTLNLTAPTSGTYSGIVFFQDRSSNAPLNVGIPFGGGNATLTGIVYAPKAALNVTGNATLTAPSGEYILRDLNVSLNGNFVINPLAAPLVAVAGAASGASAAAASSGLSLGSSSSNGSAGSSPVSNVLNVLASKPTSDTPNSKAILMTFDQLGAAAGVGVNDDQLSKLLNDLGL